MTLIFQIAAAFERIRAGSLTASTKPLDEEQYEETGTVGITSGIMDLEDSETDTDNEDVILVIITCLIFFMQQNVKMQWQFLPGQPKCECHASISPLQSSELLVNLSVGFLILSRTNSFPNPLLNGNKAPPK